MSRCFSILIICLLLPLSCLYAQEKRALLIGIGDYPEKTGWSRIHGNNDVHIIRETLVSQGFDQRNIKELVDSSATYTNIIVEMQSLLESASKDDVIYIQFSGHGQQITDLDGDERDCLDEAWIPYDAHKKYSEGVYEGDKHIVDDYLNEYLTRLRIKVGYGGKIVVIADACHSGSGTRGIGDPEMYMRGTGSSFVIPKQPANVIRKERVGDWMFVAACKSYQTNYEYKTDNGDYYGSLSYCIAGSSAQLSEVNYEEALIIWGQSLSKIIIYPQQLDGEGRPSKKSLNLL